MEGDWVRGVGECGQGAGGVCGCGGEWGGEGVGVGERVGSLGVGVGEV